MIVESRQKLNFIKISLKLQLITLVHTNLQQIVLVAFHMVLKW